MTIMTWSHASHAIHLDKELVVTPQQIYEEGAPTMGYRIKKEQLTRVFSTGDNLLDRFSNLDFC